MTEHQRALGLLAIAQTLCLACGLWVGDQFLLDSFKQDTATFQADSAGNPATGHMLIVRALTLVWIGGLQIGVAYMVLTRLRNDLSQSHSESEMRLLHREKDLVRTRNAVIFGLAKLADYRDRETGQHLERIALYSTCLATALRRDPRFEGRIPASFVKLIGISSVLHDIGKVAIEDAILRKEGRLEPEERKRMQLHTGVGAECIREIEQRLGSCNFLSMARDIAQCHHERWDGQGYPNGVSGEEIPLAARVVAIADVYDALVSKRVYKDSYPHEKCLELIAEGRGAQFDPEITDVFLKVAGQFREIAERFRDNSQPTEHGVSESARVPKRLATDSLINSLLEEGAPVTPMAATL
jgi:HD-GYP domain-containing protein (c-di-GMP phosphodiesterase class II)